MLVSDFLGFVVNYLLASLERKTHRISTYQAKVLCFAATHSSLWWGFQWGYLGQTVLLLLTVHMSALKSLRTEMDQLHSLSILLHHLQPLKKKKKERKLHLKNTLNQCLRKFYLYLPSNVSIYSYIYLPQNREYKVLRFKVLYTNTPKPHSLLRISSFVYWWINMWATRVALPTSQELRVHKDFHFCTDVFVLLIFAIFYKNENWFFRKVLMLVRIQLSQNRLSLRITKKHH